MRCAPDNGVFLRSSTAALPGEWEKLLATTVKRSHRHDTLLSDIMGIGECLQAIIKPTSIQLSLTDMSY
ncbi:hypothetical protein K437DRAFT_257988 [Tilletiaria anomala UBC 951]|uniref:Uncharacterized protein n=1 Tax=Tilletiaria anomala (strain ATCC 24038 / CBS 436.72 / UBC 951) TaxID=1037660 RepID=A0A066VL53_TILAU|nr:uncharacterized protein K437DRAFT_257988 [Tilletiaria anomala UBC 951]KDN42211.1 hypothetical protein K437DRAFT_257988 [Tilletiaria anomala UBC 951]